MATNSGFRLCKEERNQSSFFIFLDGSDVYSENMRAIPYHFARGVSEIELSGKLKITAVWGSSWDIGISRNQNFYFMEKAGWNKFVRENVLGDGDFLTFTHKGNMHFSVNIFKKDSSEMIHPPQSMASSTQIKREQDEMALVLVSPDVVPTTAETSGGGKDKRKKPVRDSAGASSSSVAEFTIFIKKSSITTLGISASISKTLMPKERTTFKIHHPDMKRSWDVGYLPTRPTGTSCLSGGWKRLTKEYPILVGDTCEFTFMNPTELLLVLSNPIMELD